MSKTASHPDRRQIQSMAQTALDGVRQGQPAETIVQQLEQAGLDEAMARRLVQYAREVELLNAAQTVAIEAVRLGQPSRQIVDSLRQMGVDDLVAAGIVDRARRHHQRSLFRSGTILLAMGLLWLAASIALILRSGLQELRLGICGFGLGFPLVWLGCQRRRKAS